jgi:outer membrane protein TolC
LKFFAGVASAAAVAVSAVLLAAPIEAQAETQSERALTLAEAISMALDHGESVRQARAGLALALADSARAASRRRPQVEGRSAYTRTLASEFEDIDFSFGGDDGSGDGGLGDLPFGQENRYDLGVSASQVLFAGGGIGASEKAARFGVDAAQISIEATRAALTLDVVGAYFDAALTDRLVAIAEESLAQATRTHVQAKTAFEVGDAAEFDVLRAEVARDNERPGLLDRKAQRDLAHLRLRQLLDLPADSRLVLATEAPASGLFDSELPAGTDDPAEALAERRAPLRQAEAQVSIRQQLVRVAQAARYPGVSLSSDYGRVAYPASGLPSWNDTRDNWTVGLSMRVPIFTGGALKADILAAEARLEDARATRDLAHKLAVLETRDALERRATAQEVWQVSSGVVSQARRAYDIAEVRYREGISTQLELDNARLLLRQAEANRALAARDLEVARARVALLVDLPLGAASSSSNPSSSFDRSGGR